MHTVCFVMASISENPAFQTTKPWKTSEASMERCRVPKSKSTQSCVFNWMPYRKMKQWPLVTEIGGEVITVLGGTLICLKPE